MNYVPKAFVYMCIRMPSKNKAKIVGRSETTDDERQCDSDFGRYYDYISIIQALSIFFIKEI